jgi:Zn-dependent protease
MRVEVRPSVIFFFALMAAVSVRFLGWPRGIWAGAAITVSVLVHEIGHALIARRYGIKVKAIGMSMMGGYTVREQSKKLRAEVLTTLAGPLVNLGLSVGFAINADGASCWVAFANFLLAATNLVPLGPSDGMRLWKLFWVPR